MKEKNQRRAFINKGLKSITKFLVDNEIPKELDRVKSKIKMLTPDGKLVEVDADAVKNKLKTSNKDILQWMKEGKTDSSD